MADRAAKLESETAAIKLDLGILKAVAAKADLAEAIAGTGTAVAEAKNAIIASVVASVFLGQLLPGLFRKLGLQ